MSKLRTHNRRALRREHLKRSSWDGQPTFRIEADIVSMISALARLQPIPYSPAGRQRLTWSLEKMLREKVRA